MILCRSLSEDLVKMLLASPKSSLHDLAQVLMRRSCGDPGKIHSKSSLHEDFADAMSSRCLYDSSCGRLLGGSCIKIL